MKKKGTLLTLSSGSWLAFYCVQYWGWLLGNKHHPLTLVCDKPRSHPVCNQVERLPGIDIYVELDPSVPFFVFLMIATHRRVSCFLVPVVCWGSVNYIKTNFICVSFFFLYHIWNDGCHLLLCETVLNAVLEQSRSHTHKHFYILLTGACDGGDHDAMHSVNLGRGENTTWAQLIVVTWPECSATAFYLIWKCLSNVLQ